MIAIEHNGQKMWVHSLAGHEGCKVIAENVEPSPDPCSVCPKTGKAIVDPVAKERARINAMSKADLVEYILSQVNK